MSQARMKSPSALVCNYGWLSQLLWALTSFQDTKWRGTPTIGMGEAAKQNRYYCNVSIPIYNVYKIYNSPIRPKNSLVVLRLDLLEVYPRHISIWNIVKYYMAMDQYLLIQFLVGWTSINPSYFDVNRRGTIGFDTLPYVLKKSMVLWK